MIAPIETSFEGVRYRSRTEARWAVFLTVARIPFEYEREGFELASGRYLPDFWLPEAKAWLEIKGAEPTDRERALCRELAAETGAHVLLAAGSPHDCVELEIVNLGGVTDYRALSPTADHPFGRAFDRAKSERFGVYDNKRPEPAKGKARWW